MGIAGARLLVPRSLINLLYKIDNQLRPCKVNLCITASRRYRDHQVPVHFPMRGSRIFCQCVCVCGGGGGGRWWSRSNCQEKALATVFFSSQHILQSNGLSMVNFKENFSKVSEGVQHFPGGVGGSPNANFYRNP